MGVRRGASSRDRRVGRIALSLGLGGGLLSLVGALALHYGRLRQLDFVRGFGVGVLAALPLFFGALILKAVLTMDEYGQRVHQQAASLAFVGVMVLAGTLVSLEAVLGFHTPAWVYYAAGMTGWGVLAAVVHLRGRG